MRSTVKAYCWVHHAWKLQKNICLGPHRSPCQWRWREPRMSEYVRGLRWLETLQKPSKSILHLFANVQKTCQFNLSQPKNIQKPAATWCYSLPEVAKHRKTMLSNALALSWGQSNSSNPGWSRAARTYRVHFAGLQTHLEILPNLRLKEPRVTESPSPRSHSHISKLRVSSPLHECDWWLVKELCKSLQKVKWRWTKSFTSFKQSFGWFWCLISDIQQRSTKVSQCPGAKFSGNFNESCFNQLQPLWLHLSRKWVWACHCHTQTTPSTHLHLLHLHLMSLQNCQSIHI